MHEYMSRRRQEVFLDVCRGDKDSWCQIKQAHDPKRYTTSRLRHPETEMLEAYNHELSSHSLLATASCGSFCHGLMGLKMLVDSTSAYIRQVSSHLTIKSRALWWMSFREWKPETQRRGAMHWVTSLRHYWYDCRRCSVLHIALFISLGIRKPWVSQDLSCS